MQKLKNMLPSIFSMLRVQGHSKPEEKIKSPIDYHRGATKAYKCLLTWMKEKVPYGVTSLSGNKRSFNFEGRHFTGVVSKGLDCRRIDLDVIKGEILKS